MPRGIPGAAQEAPGRSKNFEECPKGVPRRVQGGLREGHVLQTICFKLFLRHPKKPHDDIRNFEDGTGRAQGGLWEGHVLK